MDGETERECGRKRERVREKEGKGERESERERGREREKNVVGPLQDPFILAGVPIWSRLNWK